MNISREKDTDLSEIIKIEITESDYETSVKNRIKEFQKNYSHPGFRPGKVPSSLIWKIAGSQILTEEVDKIVSESLYKYIDDNNIKVLGSPLPDMDRQKPIDFDAQKDFELFFKVALAPDIDVTLDENINLNEYEIEATDDMIQRYIKDTQARLGTTIEPELSELTDYLFGKFEQLSDDGNVIDHGISNSATVAIDMVLNKTIQKSLIGLKVGNVVKINPMKAYKNNETEVAHMLNITKEIAKTLKSDFNYTIEKITRRELAKIDDDFFKKVFPQDNITGIKELEDRVRQDVKISFSAETQKKYMQDAIEALIKKYDFKMDDEFMKDWVIATNNSKNKPTREYVETHYNEYAKEIKWQIIMADIATKYELEVGAEDIKRHIVELFTIRTANNPDIISRAEEFANAFMLKEENRDQIRSIHDHILEQKLIGLLKEKTTNTVKNITYQEFIELTYGKKQ